jgi:hypothetical protein
MHLDHEPDYEHAFATHVFGERDSGQRRVPSAVYSSGAGRTAPDHWSYHIRFWLSVMYVYGTDAYARAPYHTRQRCSHDL